MKSEGLLFIPDISGFTRFIHETEIAHSSLIIKELLEILINANEIGLEISEIEGDAILFYKYGNSPDLESMYRQVEKMFCAFHRNLMAYEYRRFCQCKACTTAVHLTLKVITHYGEFTEYTVKHFSKLIGKDVIVAHQLLKNEIAQHEYWLVTKQLLENNHLGDLTRGIAWNSDAKKTETGEIPFHYTLLSDLKKNIQADPVPRLQLQQKTKVISLTSEYETDIITLFHATGDFNYRHRWQEGVTAVEEVNHFLPRVGMRCKCISDTGHTSIYSTSYSYTKDRIEFSETSETDKSVTYYTLEKTGRAGTRLSIDIYVSTGLPSELLFRLTKKKKLEEVYSKSLENLKALVKEIKLPALPL
jgi:hypothetical protein